MTFRNVIAAVVIATVVIGAVAFFISGKFGARNLLPAGFAQARLIGGAWNHRGDQFLFGVYQEAKVRKFKQQADYADRYTIYLYDARANTTEQVVREVIDGNTQPAFIIGWLNDEEVLLYRHLFPFEYYALKVPSRQLTRRSDTDRINDTLGTIGMGDILPYKIYNVIEKFGSIDKNSLPPQPYEGTLLCGDKGAFIVDDSLNILKTIAEPFSGSFYCSAATLGFLSGEAPVFYPSPADNDGYMLQVGNSLLAYVQMQTGKRPRVFIKERTGDMLAQIVQELGGAAAVAEARSVADLQKFSVPRKGVRAQL